MKKQLIPSAFILLLITAILGWQIGPRVLGQFQYVCSGFDYRPCLRPYEQFHSYYQVLFVVFGLVTLGLFTYILFGAFTHRSKN